ncbi:uncharacterized protein [Palaemon carinicauda]|uniref:uncharacterized protein n=1 Tax=Palaemon carinicauda TaxID=392227 RepID=UPI0035B5DC1C
MHDFLSKVFVLCLAALASAAPKPQGDAPVVAILRDERVDQGDGNFNYAFEADNGISMQVSGTPGSEGQVNMEGVYLLPLADGGFAEIRFIANENGFQPSGDILPTPHPLPAHAIEQIRFAEEQRDLGVTFESSSLPSPTTPSSRPTIFGILTSPPPFHQKCLHLFFQGHHNPHSALSPSQPPVEVFKGPRFPRQTSVLRLRSTMKAIFVLCLAALASAAPKPQGDGPVVAILRDERVDQGDGNFNYAFEADNGISMQVSGTPGSEGQVNMEGVYILPLADGGFAEIRFIANENGFQPSGDILPTPHPLPAHAIEQIRFAEEQRALGVTFE